MADDATPIGASMLYVTCASVNEARSIAGALLEKGLIACANILPGMLSVYRWQGAVSEEDETVLLLKTMATRVPAVIECVRALHSYDVPCVVELPVARGNPAFFDWIAAEAQGGAD